MKYPEYAEIFEAINDLSSTYLDFFKHFVERAERSLELGCGGGRLLVPLAKMGHWIDGVDRDPSMVAAVRSHLVEIGQARCAIYEQDFSTALEPIYDVAYFSNDTFALASSPEERCEAFGVAADALKCGGLLIIPVTHPAQYMGVRFNEFVASGDLPGGGVVEMTELRTNDLISGLRIGHKSEACSRDGEREVRSIVRSLGMVLPPELEILAVHFGMETLQTYGAFDRRPLAVGSDRYIWVGRKVR